MVMRKWNDPYEARTLEEIQAEGYPDIRTEELKLLDRRSRDEDAMIRSGLYGGCVIQ